MRLDLLTRAIDKFVSLTSSSTTIIASSTVNANSTSSYSTVVDCSSGGVKSLGFSIVGTFATSSASPNYGLRLQVFYSPDGVTYDTDTWAIIEPTFAAGSGTSQTKQKSRPVSLLPGYYKCNVVNLDTGVAATAVVVKAIKVV